MRIGLLTNFLALGEANDSGIGQHFRILADALAADGHAVHVIHPQEQPEPARAALHQLAPPWTWEVVPAKPPTWLYRPWQLNWASYALVAHLWTAREVSRHFARTPRAAGLDVLETHTYNLPAYVLLNRRRRPRIVSRVSTTMSQMVEISPVHTRALGWEAALERRTTRRSDALVTHTRQHRDIICALEGHDPARFHLVPHGVADPGPPPPLSTARADGEVEFLFVGRFENRKGIDVLLAAIPSVAAAYPGARFTLAGGRGDGTEWRAFEQAHPQLAGSRVLSPGRVSPAELARLYRRCDVFVAPSRYESFGLIFAEAMSYAKPVIGCRAGGIPEVVQEGVTGLLAAPGDAPSLVACLSQLAASADLRLRLGAAARADYLARFSARQLAAASAALYREVLTGAFSRPPAAF